MILFPVWWYTRGVRSHAQACWKELKDGGQIFPLRILLRHLLTPLYGYRDWKIVLISLPLRFVHFQRGDDPKNGVRPLRRVIQDTLEDPHRTDPGRGRGETPRHRRGGGRGNDRRAKGTTTVESAS